MRRDRISRQEKQANQPIRDTLERMDIPVDRQSMKQDFLKRAEQVRNTNERTQRWAWLWSPRVALGAAVTFALILLLNIVFSLSGNPVMEIDTPRPWGALESLRHSFCANTARSFGYERGTHITLGDGSTVRCLESSTIAFEYKPMLRRIWLQHGQIEILAAHDPQSVMIVDTGKVDVQVTGTRFIVTVEPEEEKP